MAHMAYTSRPLADDQSIFVQERVDERSRLNFTRTFYAHDFYFGAGDRIATPIGVFDYAGAVELASALMSFLPAGMSIPDTNFGRLRSDDFTAESAEMDSWDRIEYRKRAWPFLIIGTVSVGVAISNPKRNERTWTLSHDSMAVFVMWLMEVICDAAPRYTLHGPS